MTSLNDVRKLIYNTFITDWNNETPFTFDNEQFDAQTDPWVRVTVRNTGSSQETLGAPILQSRRFLRSGSVFIQVFVLSKSGTFEGDRLSELARDIFEAKTITTPSVWFSESAIRENGVDGEWYQYTVETTFTYETKK